MKRKMVMSASVLILHPAKPPDIGARYTRANNESGHKKPAVRLKGRKNVKQTITAFRSLSYVPDVKIGPWHQISRLKNQASQSYILENEWGRCLGHGRSALTQGNSAFLCPLERIFPRNPAGDINMKTC